MNERVLNISGMILTWVNIEKKHIPVPLSPTEMAWD
jgi:hypothetical protein